ncbi:hypothetical protein [Jannaschia sp. 2305UL9-9]|uniref:hypothetical protein n=1 Tax=Jannaschia sp. 2305UL9-9 TaxID=3121638 RepID=UPI00352714D2
MRASPTLLPLLAAMTLAACDPPVPDSGAQGAGFETPDQYAQRREAELSTGVRAPQAVRPPATEAEELASQTRAILGGGSTSTPATTAAPAPVATATIGTPAPLPTIADPATLTTATATATVDPSAVDLSRDNPTLSREQDFGAVSAERSIQDDAARVNAARQQYQLVQPTELERPNDNGPNIIAYAIERARPVGASGTYRRAALASTRRSEQKCEGYRTDDVAQEEFLSAGGPERDRLNLDPDGDGNACAWDPATFRNLVRQ